MPLYKTILTRTFDVIIEATDENAALRLVEFYVGYGDHSNQHDRDQFHFEIKHIELTENEGVEANAVNETDEYSEFLE